MAKKMEWTPAMRARHEELVRAAAQAGFEIIVNPPEADGVFFRAGDGVLVPFPESAAYFETSGEGAVQTVVADLCAAYEQLLAEEGEGR